MNPGLVLLLILGVSGLATITWLTIAGFRQQWIEYRARKINAHQNALLRLKVKSRSNFSDTLFRVELTSEKEKALPAFTPGQYLTLLIPQEGKKNKLRRSYSLASWQQVPEVYELAIKLETSGKGSTWLFDALHQGAIIEAIKPKGSFTLSSHDKEIILVAGGIGITPLRSMVHYLSTLHSVPSVKLFFASRYREGLCYNDEFIAYQEKYSWFTYFPILSQPDPAWQGLTGRLNGSLIKQHLENLLTSQFYFCAGTEMMDAIMRDLMQYGIDQHQFHFENFAVSSGNVGEGSFTINVAGYGDVVYENVATIFQALENQDYPIQGDCRVGQCGLCKMRLNNGSVKWITQPEALCTEKEFLPCICQPTENLEISH